MKKAFGVEEMESTMWNVRCEGDTVIIGGTGDKMVKGFTFELCEDDGTFKFNVPADCEKFEVLPDHRFLESRDGVLYSKKGKLLRYPSLRKDTDYIVPANTSEIGASAFKDSQYLEKVEIPGHLDRVCTEGFSNCRNLRSVTFRCDVGRFESHCFLGCECLEEVKIGRMGHEVPEAMFLGCESLREFEVPKGVTIIGESAFRHTALKTMILPDSINTIGNYAFGGNNNLSYLEIPKDVLIGNMVLHNSMLKCRLVSRDGNGIIEPVQKASDIAESGNMMAECTNEYGFYRDLGCPSEPWPEPKSDNSLIVAQSSPHAL